MHTMPYARRSRARRATRPATRRRLQTTGKRSRLHDAVRTGAAYGAAAAKVYKTASGMYKDYKGESSSSSARARTQVVRPQIDQDYRRTAMRYGRPKSAAYLARKLTRTQINRSIYTLRNYGGWNRGQGNIQIMSRRALTAGSLYEAPVHLWELTGVPQFTSGFGSGAAAVKYPSCFYRLFFTDFGGDLGLADWQSTTGFGTAPLITDDTDSSSLDKQFQLYPTWVDTILPSQAINSSANLNVGPGSKSYIESFKASLILNGPRQRPTKWCIQLVQLSDEVTPGHRTANGLEYTAFWQAIAKPYGYSPIEQGLNFRQRKHIKVLKSTYVTMDTPESTEDHLSCRMAHLDFKGNLNRTAKYDWGQRNDLVNLVSPDVPENANFTNGLHEHSTHVHPNARMYIMVRALCQVFDSDVLPAEANAVPSYDIKLNVTHRSLD